MDNEEEGTGAAIDNEEPVHIRLKQFFAEKFDNCTNAFQKNLTPLQQGVAYALIILFLAQSISLLLNYTFILTILYNLLNNHAVNSVVLQKKISKILLIYQLLWLLRIVCCL